MREDEVEKLVTAHCAGAFPISCRVLHRQPLDEKRRDADARRERHGHVRDRVGRGSEPCNPDREGAGDERDEAGGREDDERDHQGESMSTQKAEGSRVETDVIDRIRHIFQLAATRAGAGYAARMSSRAAARSVQRIGTTP